MKINLIPTKKLAMLSAAFCAAMLAFSQNASALTVGDANDLGFVTGGTIPGDQDRTNYLNHLISMAPTTTDLFDGRAFTRRGTNPGPGFPNYPTAVFDHSGTSNTINLGSGGVYSYLWVTYSIAGAFVAGQVWYIGNLSGDITIPSIEGLNLNGWTLFTAGGQGVPDGGTTVMLLGAALGALGMARRFLKA